MVNQQPEKSRADLESQPEHETVDLTVDQLRSVAGGIFLNIAIEKAPKADGNPHGHNHHGKR